MWKKIINKKQQWLDKDQLIYVRFSEIRDTLLMQLDARQEAEGGYLAGLHIVRFGYYTTSNTKD